MSSASIIPLLSSVGVFSGSTSVVIDADRDKVWNVLLGFPQYREWNPFTRGHTMISKSTGKPLADQTPKEGEHLLLSPVHIPPTMDDASVWFPTSSLEVVLTVDHENYRLAWRYISLPRWLLCAVRWQVLTEIEEGKTRYESVEAFTGIFAYVVGFFMKASLQKGFEEMGKALKARVEKV